MVPAIEIRLLAPSDDLHALTALLNRAYAPLAAAGMNFTAATQTVETTRERMAAADTLVAVDEAGRIVGTITLARPVDPQRHEWVREHAWLAAPDVAHLKQFAVEPTLQRAGLGRRLVDAAVEQARLRGAARIVLDTAEPAAHLRRWYDSMGWRAIGVDQWPGKAYRSVIYERPLPTSPLRAHLLTMARYDAWATAELMRHVDALPEADYRRDTGLFFRSIHGTLNHLLVTGHGLWWPRFSAGISPRAKLDEEVEADRAALGSRLVAGAPDWLGWLAGLDEARLGGMLDYTTSKGVPASLPFAPTLGHVFNHGTHHRGQITAAITALGHACPEIDLVWMLLKQGARPAPLAARIEETRP
jgi:uncharacterized damage-inducible protein DinB/predicted N-acetyltransferase YhbS